MTRADMQREISRAADILGVQPQWLDALIRFESNYDPRAVNRYSGACGLIQVTNTTARDVFHAESAAALVEKFPTFTSQIDNIVIPYLSRYAPFPTQQSLYMAIFYPKYRRVAPTTEFPDSVAAINPGIKTVSDYVALVNRRLDPAFVKGGVAFMLMLALCLLYYYRKG